MPEADTIDRVRSRKVQVASLPPADSGRGFARLPDKLMDELGLNEGDVIEIVGKRSTAARAIRLYGEDDNNDNKHQNKQQHNKTKNNTNKKNKNHKTETNPAT